MTDMKDMKDTKDMMALMASMDKAGSHDDRATSPHTTYLGTY